MPRNVQKPLGKDVLTAALERIHHVFDTFDTVVVAFSGGKDSLVCLHLVKRVMEERGIKRPLKVFFKDQELIPDDVIGFVEEYREKDWIDLDWYCVPLHCTKYILGRIYDYVQWDSDREHLRPMPEWAIRDDSGEVYGRDNFDQLTLKKHKGRVAYITGIRCSESILRLRSVLNKVGRECYITNTVEKRLKLAKPIYDWSENDVFKFFMEEGVRYSDIYNMQHLVGRQLRVASPLQSEAAKDFHHLRASHPDYYQKLVKLFPEMLVQERYQREVDPNLMMKQYGSTFEGMRAYVEENLTEEKQFDLACLKLDEYRKLHAKAPKAYPIDHIFKYIIRGGYRKNLMPVDKASQK